MPIKGYERRKAGITAQDTAIWMKLIDSLSTDTDIKDTSNFNTVYDKMIIGADTIEELGNIKTLVGGETNIDPLLVENKLSDISQKTTAFNTARELKTDVTELKNNWANIEIEDLTIDGVVKLKNDMARIQNNLNEVQYIHGKGRELIVPPHILPTSVINNISFLNDAYTETIGDLLITERVTEDDWEVLQYNPESLPELREMRYNEFSNIYKRYQPIQEQFKNLNVHNYTDGIWDNILQFEQNTEGEVTTDALMDIPNLKPLIVNHITGEIDMTKIEDIKNAIKVDEKLGLKRYFTQELAHVNEIMKQADQGLRDWGGKSYEEERTGIEWDELQNTKKKIMGNLLSSGSAGAAIPEGDLKTENGKTYFIFENKPREVVIADPNKNTYKLANPLSSKNGNTSPNSLPSLAKSLWDNFEYGQSDLIESDKNYLTDKGLGQFIEVSMGGNSIKSFMQEARNLDKQLSDSGVEKVKVRVKNENNELVWKTLDLNKKWTGAENDEDFKILANILKSNSYSFGTHIRNNDNFSLGFSNLEYTLSNTK